MAVVTRLAERQTRESSTAGYRLWVFLEILNCFDSYLPPCEGGLGTRQIPPISEQPLQSLCFLCADIRSPRHWFAGEYGRFWVQRWVNLGSGIRYTEGVMPSTIQVTTRDHIRGEKRHMSPGPGPFTGRDIVMLEAMKKTISERPFEQLDPREVIEFASKIADEFVRASTSRWAKNEKAGDGDAH